MGRVSVLELRTRCSRVLDLSRSMKRGARMSFRFFVRRDKGHNFDSTYYLYADIMYNGKIKKDILI